MKRFNIRLYNVYGAIIHDETVLAPDAFQALISARETYFNLFPSIRPRMLAKSVEKFTCEAQK